MEPIEIAKIWKHLKGSYNFKCTELCDLIGLKYERLPRYLYKYKEGDTDGFVIRTKSLRDQFDLHTLFHEIGHTQLHWRGANNPIYDYKDYTENLSKRESEANDYADEVMKALYGNSIDNLLRVCRI